MKRTFLIISWLWLMVVSYHSTLAAEALSFDTQLFEAHKTILSQPVATHKGFTPNTVRSPSPEKEPITVVEMSVSWSRPEELYITEQNLKLNVLGNRNWSSGVIVFNGDLNATAEPIFPNYFSFGYHLKGPNVDISIGQAGPVLRGYFISGTYKRTDKTKPIYLAIYLAPSDDGWDITTKGMTLHVSDEVYGSSIEGYINQNDIGKLELSILCACLGAVIYSPG
ncbi:MAG: hypothetical protein HY746_10880 [Elusimicrobia bacterium]|nr:hypothetical protein [Elusimicrobiota bacterium]